MDKNKVIIDIAPQLRGRVNPRNLLGANGTIAFWINSSQLIKESGHLFKVASPDYHLEVGFTEVSFYIKRNGQRLEMPIEPYREAGDINCYAIWQPTELSLLILDKSYGEAISSDADNTDEMKKRKKILKTPSTIPPKSLVDNI